MRHCADNPADTRDRSAKGDDRKDSPWRGILKGIKPVFRSALEIVLPLSCVICGKNSNFSSVATPNSESKKFPNQPSADQTAIVCALCDPWSSGEPADMLLNAIGSHSEQILSDPDPLYCSTCGELTPLLNPASARCFFCDLYELDFEIRSLWRYTPQLEQLIKQLKYYGRFLLAPYIGKQMAEAVISTGGQPCGFTRGCFAQRSWDLIVPIPSSPERIRTRGFSHTALIAREIAMILKSQFAYNALRSIGRREPQASLPLERRAENVRGCFKAAPTLVTSASILVIDDLLTTGATVTEAVRSLRRAGAKDVAVLTLARTFRFQELRVLARRRRIDG